MLLPGKLHVDWLARDVSKLTSLDGRGDVPGERDHSLHVVKLPAPAVNGTRQTSFSGSDPAA
jgi:hypothetical protein